MKRRNGTVAAAILLLGLLIACARLLMGCSPRQQGMVLDVAGHSLALAQCRAEGKDAGSYVVYEKCADEADRHFMDGGAR